MSKLFDKGTMQKPSAATHLLDDPPYLPFADSAPTAVGLPGLRPLQPEQWLVVDPDYSAQMAARRALVDGEPDTVVDWTGDAGLNAARELLAVATHHLASRPDFACHGDRLTTPDGETVALDASQPLATLGRLVAEDFCLLQAEPPDNRYRLSAAVLCFPSSWRLADKLGRPLVEIHAPVPHYDAAIADRVERVFHRLRVDRPAWRCNWLICSVPDLFLAPRSRSSGGHRHWQDYYLRTERQTLRRLPQSGAVVFGIKTSICPLGALDATQQDALCGAIGKLDDAAKRYTTDGSNYDLIARQIAADRKAAAVSIAQRR